MRKRDRWRMRWKKCKLMEIDKERKRRVRGQREINKRRDRKESGKS